MAYLRAYCHGTRILTKYGEVVVCGDGEHMDGPPAGRRYVVILPDNSRREVFATYAEMAESMPPYFSPPLRPKHFLCPVGDREQWLRLIRHFWPEEELADTPQIVTARESE